jgi:signal transduction histidine kinase
LLNLIRNAVEAMSPHGGTIRFETRCEQHQMCLIMRDTGPGIGERDIDRIFNPFFTTRKSGTGLGLAIVHRIVDVHGGAITVANDGGAVFTLSLPLSIEQAPSAAAVMGASA